MTMREFSFSTHSHSLSVSLCAGIDVIRKPLPSELQAEMEERRRHLIEKLGAYVCDVSL